MHLKVCIILGIDVRQNVTKKQIPVEKYLKFHKSGIVTCKINNVMYIIPDPPVMNYEPWIIKCGDIRIGEVFPLNFTESDWYAAIREAQSK